MHEPEKLDAPAMERRFTRRTETTAGPDAPLATAWGGLTALARTADWWEHKLACLLGTAYALAYYQHVSMAAAWPLLLQIFGSFLPCAAYVCVINDVTDVAEDRRAGKPNRMASRSVAFRAGALGGCVLLGVAADWQYRAYPLTLTLYAANWLAFTLYSAPPFRWKTRGGWGVLADACGGQLLPTMWIAEYISEASGHPLDPYLGFPLGAWALALGLRGILGHQLRDWENDRRAGVNTLVARVGPDPVRRFVAWGCFPVEIVALLCLLARLDAPLAWPLLALQILIEARRADCPRVLAEWRTPRPERWWPSAEYYKFAYPVTFALALAWRDAAALVLIPLHLFLFRRCGRQFAEDLRRLARVFVPAGFRQWVHGSLR